jgi:hypothetical protein
MMISQAWIRIIRVVLVLTTIASLVGLMLVFTLGLRIYDANQPTALRWVGYFGALTLAIGSRHIDVLLGFWLVAVFLIVGFLRRFSREYVKCAASPWWKAGLAAVCSPKEERKRLAERIAGSVPDGDVKAAILDQPTIGSFYEGTGAAISRRLAAQGYQGEALGAKTDTVILEASMAYFGSLHPKLVGVIGRDFWDGLWRVTNSSIAVAPFDHNRYAAEARPEQPDLWRPLDNLHSSFLPEAIAWEDRASKDSYVSSGKRLQLGWLFVLTVLLCVACCIRQAAVPGTVILSLSVMVAGLVIFGATIVCVGFQSRYALPLQVSGLVGVSLAFVGVFEKSDLAGLKARPT